ncbi:hypothetical protein C3B59_00035 [Cryobacterium zongtaii]|uniref:Uncharacterized protein n=1 Tax=Cryobacterium zongtaii TaxID=1259217 RepID=A0A2S3ZR21_9MICO|nr:hypothetical protein [Cryobacterium zongtaii]POH71549.1 hypothetical protein C3B59_00035 [Cryobacterium zongtaii]
MSEHKGYPSVVATLVQYGNGWWSDDDAQHVLADIVDEDEPDRSWVAQVMWSMGAWLKHPKCRNNPKRGNDGDYENGCMVCERYLLTAADAVLHALALSRMTEDRDRLEAIRAEVLEEVNGMLDSMDELTTTEDIYRVLRDNVLRRVLPASLIPAGIES